MKHSRHFQTANEDEKGTRAKVKKNKVGAISASSNNRYHPFSTNMKDGTATMLIVLHQINVGSLMMQNKFSKLFSNQCAVSLTHYII